MKHFLIFLGGFDISHVNKYLKDPVLLELRDLIRKLGYELDFAPYPNRNYEGVQVINQITINEIQVSVKKGNVFCLMQEPGNRILHNFMYKNLGQYDVVFSPVKSAANVQLSQPYLNWGIAKTISEMENWAPPPKTKLLSCVMSNATTLAGHRKRLHFLQQLKHQTSLDHFGRGFNPIKNKQDALLSYYYSIAIENSSKDYYFSEKINDCFLCYSIPLYHGCTNIDKFFPPQSYIKINPNDVRGTVKIINDQLGKKDYEQRLPYLKEAREIVLRKYNYSSLFEHKIMPILANNKNQPYTSHTLKATKLHLLLRIAKKILNIIRSLNA